MKTLLQKLLICVSFLITELTVAQTFPSFSPLNAQWLYCIHDEGQWPAKEMLCVGEGMIDNKFCKTFLISSYGVFPEDGSFHIYRDSLKMYIHGTAPNSKWELLYNFDWSIGQQVYIPKIEFLSWSYTEDSILFTVTSKKDTVINGYTLPEIILDDTVRVILNLGMLDQFFVPNDLMPSTNCRLLRYRDSTMGQQTFAADCKPTSVPEEHVYKELKVYPNPANGSFTVDAGTEGKDVVFSMYDVTGRRLYKKTVTQQKTIIADFIEKGLFFWRAEREGEIVQTGKILLE